MKILKAICIMFGIIFFTCLFFTPFLYGDAVKEWIIVLMLEILFALLTLICMMAHKVLVDHEENVSEWQGLYKRKPQ
jgi:predicted membrane protein